MSPEILNQQTHAWNGNKTHKGKTKYIKIMKQYKGRTNFNTKKRSSETYSEG